MRFFIYSISRGLLIVVFLFAGAAARADSLFNQGPPNGNSFDITDFRLADDFSLTKSATVDEIGFWYQAQEQTDLAAVTYGIYQDASGSLGTLLQSGTIDNPGTSFDNSSGLFFADFGITPLALAGGTEYWLELHAGSSLIDTSGFTVSWGAADDNSTQLALENQTLDLPDSQVGVSGFDQYAFQLSGPTVSTATPEPAAVMIIPGLLLAGLMMRSKILGTKRGERNQ